MKTRLFQIDAFAKDLFSGNPAGVCLVSAGQLKDAALLSRIAAEMNLSETAFLSRTEDGRDATYDLRWFTPAVEVALCGHATLSSAFVLFSKGIEDASKTIEFRSKSGPLTAKKVGDRIELDFPAYPIEELGAQSHLERIFGTRFLFAGASGSRWLLEVEDKQTLMSLKPQFDLREEWAHHAFIVTCRSEESEYDYFLRFFAPYVGIYEDPVTGSAQSWLVPYWAARLGRKTLRSLQLSARRGELECELSVGDRVLIRGHAVIFFETEIDV